jgi:hypothetical protein
MDGLVDDWLMDDDESETGAAHHHPRHETQTANHEAGQQQTHPAVRRTWGWS